MQILRALVAIASLFALLALNTIEVHARSEDLQSIPREMGLPIEVRTSINFLQIKAINENEGNFEAVIDTQLIWTDHRLAFDKMTTPRGYIEYRNEDASKRLNEIWRPDAAYLNRIGEPASEIKNLRIYPDGTINYLQRIEAKFETEFELASFPYDHQNLVVHLISRTEPTTRVIFTFTESELRFSNSTKPTKIDGWEVGTVSLQKGVQEGLRGTQYPEMTASLKVQREPFVAMATIIIPLLCCLLIPLLVLWINTLDHGEHEGFGMSNTEIATFPMSGIFAVVALNFTVVTSYSALGHGDNPVVRLFGLNYIMLGVSFFISIVLYRYYLIKRFFGRYIQDEFFTVICWALPLLCFGLVLAILQLANTNT